jgi:hypothetical protein
MTHAELSAALYVLDVDPALYRLDGTHYELAHVLAQDESGWRVFQSERGGESGVLRFDDEADACVHLLGQLCADLHHRGELHVMSSGWSFGRVLLDVDGWEPRVDDAYPADVTRVIDRLDGRTHTLMSLQGLAERPTLGVGGGNAGMYVVVYEDLDGRFHNLASGAPGHGRLEVVTGGQPGDFERRHVADRATAKRAALWFCDTGRRCPDFAWERAG